jgi:hypothetical protein
LCLLLARWASSVGAEESNEPSPSAKGEYAPSGIAKQLDNPLSSLREVILQLDVLPSIGPDDKTDWATTIQRVMSFVPE